MSHIQVRLPPSTKLKLTRVPPRRGSLAAVGGSIALGAFQEPVCYKWIFKGPVYLRADEYQKKGSGGNKYTYVWTSDVHVWGHVSIRACVHAFFLRTCTRVHFCEYVRMCACTHVFLCIHTCVHVCGYVCMCACILVCLCIHMRGCSRDTSRPAARKTARVFLARYNTLVTFPSKRTCSTAFATRPLLPK